MQRSREGQDGFTLLELLISLVIFSFIALAAYQALRVMIEGREVTAKHSAELRSLIRAVNMLETDMQQIMLESFRYPPKGQDVPESLRGNLHAKGSLDFIRRGGSSLAGDGQAKVMHIRWQLQDGRLQRSYWGLSDGGPVQPRVQEVLSDVLVFNVRYLDSKSVWRDDWKSPVEPGREPMFSVPRAIEVSLQHKLFGRIHRLFLLPEPTDDARDESDRAATHSEGAG
ncbi:type II secretion system minor pseudopilin GspJ [Pseudomonas sp. EpS/L25]|uniref:type II secretion system minor pseudopilin GspJ n=1 Tax=Pseudomonas sp. EpS/L25 TaxID=1749078 RepID=UPI0007438FB0|nr:type II secretion system minor pseudopilin GspJ [Pseudomonas sp. EpS/L25]KUM41939.1 hypothetical protein AR540_06865 [Pseudomonas sp. EpS/L25]